MKSIHISQARAMLDAGQPVSLDVVTRSGALLHLQDAVSLSYDVYTGLRVIKLLQSNQKRSVRDCLILAINDLEVFL